MSSTLGSLPEFQKPPVATPVVTTLEQISSTALGELVTYLGQFPPEIPASSIQGLGDAVGTAGGTSAQTPGAVSTVDIPHGLGGTPRVFMVQPADSDARGAPAYHLTVDDTNITLHYASALTAATEYVWVWSASP